MEGCEFLSIGGTSSHAMEVLGAMQAACREPSEWTHAYGGNFDWLMLWGVGRAEHARAWRRHRDSGRPVAMWDLGYLGRGKRGGYLRVSLNEWHPTPAQIECTRPDPVRWERLDLALREDADLAGPIVLIGMGPKSHAFLGDWQWEHRMLRSLRARFPNRRIVYRPKPGKPVAHLVSELSGDGPIEDVLRGASLLVCRHSNAAVDAVIAGVPVECEDGAARWLDGKPFTRETRLDFLHRLAWWQWKPSEAPEAWNFLTRMARET